MSPQPVTRAQAGSGPAEELQKVGITPRYVGPGSEERNARLDNNPINVIRSGSEASRDEMAVANDASVSGAIETVVATARKWQPGEEFHYWDLQNSYTSAFGQRLDTDYAAARAQALHAEDVQKQVAAIQRQNGAMLMDLSPYGYIKNGAIGLINLGIKGYSGIQALEALRYGADMETASAVVEGFKSWQIAADSPFFDTMASKMAPQVNRVHAGLENTIGVGPTAVLGATGEFIVDALAVTGTGVGVRRLAPDLDLVLGGSRTGLTYDISRWAEYGLPSDAVFSRTLTAEQFRALEAGREFRFAGKEWPEGGYPEGMGFMGAAEDARNLTTATAYKEGLQLGYQPKYVLEFQLRDPSLLQNALKAPYPEFVPGGRTGAGLREWNYPGISSHDIINGRVRELE